ncbi:MAG: M18 family aminopeptidase [Lachnospiraceae bacterium]|nr:M18 family aminopeptidase [Lachnospiraceae bacterium]
MNATQQQYEQETRALCDFIEKSPSCYHAAANLTELLKGAGFEELSEGKKWNLKPGGAYYVSRNASALIAFKIPRQDYIGFNIISSHSDSPSFKIKENAEITFEKHYTTLNVEGYGGMLCAPWFDRPLSAAGKVMVKKGDKVVTRLLYFDRDLLSIVNLAIHMNRTANTEGHAYKIQKDMLPIFSDGNADASILSLVAEELQVDKENILGTDLFLVNRMKGSIWGEKNQFFSSPKIDDLQCSYSATRALMKSSSRDHICVNAVFDNEEVGSGTKQGALSNFLSSVLHRINQSLGKDQEDYFVALTNSFMVSADNGHAIHPNYGGKGDPTNRPYVNGGVLLKSAANQKYTTDSVSEAIFRSILDHAKIPYQIFTNNSDIPGGSTLGNLANQQVSLNTVDIGVAQLAMHSPYETGGVKDTLQLTAAMSAFYGSSIQFVANGEYVIQKQSTIPD